MLGFVKINVAYLGSKNTIVPELYQIPKSTTVITVFHRLQQPVVELDCVVRQCGVNTHAVELPLFA